jgi:hypothetical protein
MRDCLPAAMERLNKKVFEAALREAAILAEGGREEGVDTVSAPSWESAVQATLLKSLKDMNLVAQVSDSYDDEQNVDKVFILIRAHRPELRREAQRMGFRVAFRDEVDPGRQFWRGKNIEQQNELLPQAKAREWLGQMREMFHDRPDIFPEFEGDLFANESQERWSMRVQVWRRVLGKYPRATNATWRWSLLSDEFVQAWNDNNIEDQQTGLSKHVVTDAWHKFEPRTGDDAHDAKKKAAQMATRAALTSAWGKDPRHLKRDGETPNEAERYVGSRHPGGGVDVDDIGPETGTGAAVWIDRSDGTPACRNIFPVYTNFDGAQDNLHLYRQQPSARDSASFFSAPDKIEITKSIVDQGLDLQLMLDKGLILGFYCLHNATLEPGLFSRVAVPEEGIEHAPGGTKDLTDLYHLWVTWWKVTRKQHFTDELGVNRVKTSGELGLPRATVLRPFCQPLNLINSYFGSKVSLYFAWLGYYTYALILPAVVGSVMSLLEVYYPSFGDGVLPAAFSMFIIIWAGAFNKGWRREEKMCALMWGTLGVESEQPVRPQFSGDMQHSSINNLYERHFSSTVRLRRKLLSNSVLCLGIGGLLAVFSVMFELKEQWGNPKHEGTYKTWGAGAVSAMQAVQIQVLEVVFNSIARWLNYRENYKTATDHEDNLIFKTFVFSVCNSYGALVYTAFIKSHTYGCAGGDCMGETRSLLVAIAFTRLGMNCVEMGVPVLKRWKRDVDDGEGGPQNTFEEEAMLEPSQDTIYQDFAEMIIQFGFVSCFAAALPLLPLLAMLENLLEIRVDAFKMCRLVQRPFPSDVAEDIGAWGHFLVVM